MSPPAARQVPLDVLRGFALLGILFVNFEFFAYPAANTGEFARREFPGALDWTADLAMRVFCDGKFILIFSFLFGYGLHVQMKRADAAGESPLPRYRRRLVGLFVIGILHAVFLFVGDILVAYAVLGFLLILFRHATPRRLVTGAAVCWGVSILCHALIGVGILFLPTADPSAPAEAAAVVAVYRDGSVGAIIADRVGTLVVLYVLTPFLFAPQVFGAFLLGLAAAKHGLLTDVSAEGAFWQRVVLWCLPVAVVGNALYTGLLEAGERDPAGAGAAAVLGMAGRAAFTPFGSAVYVGGVALLLRGAGARRWLTPLAADGRLSLTNYVGDSFIMCLLMHSYGLQLFGQVSPAQGVGLILAVFAVQTTLSNLYLTRFRVGPLEWLLRSWAGHRATPVGTRD